MDWERLPVAPLYADVRAYCSHVKMYCKRHVWCPLIHDLSFIQSETYSQPEPNKIENFGEGWQEYLRYDKNTKIGKFITPMDLFTLSFTGLPTADCFSVILMNWTTNFTRGNYIINHTNLWYGVVRKTKICPNQNSVNQSGLRSLLEPG